MQKIKLSNQEISKLLNPVSPIFPKYATQLINLANQNAQGTRPKVVGQLSDLIQEFHGNNVEKWEQWYSDLHPEAIVQATEKIYQMIDNFKSVINQIDKEMVELWVHDLVIIKTFIGLRFQEAIIKVVAENFHKEYRLAEHDDESKGIDGFIGEYPVSIKPESYDSKKSLSENIESFMIYYEKKKDGIIIYFDDDLKNNKK